MMISRPSTSRCRSNPCRYGIGFTLLEVLVAMVVLGTAIAALFGLLSSSLGNLRRVESTSRAAMLGRSKLSELLVQRGMPMAPADMSQLQLGGTVSGRWDEVTRWEATASAGSSRIASNRSISVPVKIQLAVFWRRDPNERENRLLLETTQLWPRTAINAN